MTSWSDFLLLGPFILTPLNSLTIAIQLCPYLSIIVTDTAVIKKVN